MKLYTKQGDGGASSLIGRENVPKSDPVFELLGTLDECGACLGVALLEVQDAQIRQDLSMLQDLLILLGGQAAGAAKQPLDTQLAHIEARIDDCQMETGGFLQFCNGYSSRGAAYVNLARTVMRRAEREAVRAGLCRDGLTLLNRASDLLYALTLLIQSHKKGGSDND